MKFNANLFLLPAIASLCTLCTMVKAQTTTNRKIVSSSSKNASYFQKRKGETWIPVWHWDSKKPYRHERLPA